VTAHTDTTAHDDHPGRPDRAHQPDGHPTPATGRERPLVLYVVKEYPQISQTYIKCELEAVQRDHDVVVLAKREPDLAYSDHLDFQRVETVDEALRIVEDLRPDIIHTHYLNQLAFVGELAERSQTPFTVRAHSFDVLALRRKNLTGRLKERIRAKLERSTTLARSPEFRRGLPYLGHDLCLGVLTFPFAREWLIEAGAPDDKIVDAFPAVAVDRFYDEGPNGDGVMNTGVATPKTKMEDFLKLSKLVPERPFRLYAMGYHIDELRAENDARGARVEFVPPVEPSEMPREYKRHQWLVYTADFDLATVGWPMAVAEAQASGVGVCMPRIRDDLATYVGDGGILYDSIEEIAPIVRGPAPEHLRAAGFEQARRSDINATLPLLTDLWTPVLRTRVT
jgi:hypothetical protein